MIRILDERGKKKLTVTMPCYVVSRSDLRDGDHGILELEVGMRGLIQLLAVAGNGTLQRGRRLGFQAPIVGMEEVRACGDFWGRFPRLEERSEEEIGHRFAEQRIDHQGAFACTGGGHG